MVEIADLVQQDLSVRKAQGAAKYGRPMLSTTKVDPLWECYEEILDAAIYLRAEIQRRGGRRQ